MSFVVMYVSTCNRVNYTLKCMSLYFAVGFIVFNFVFCRYYLKLFWSQNNKLAMFSNEVTYSKVTIIGHDIMLLKT